jgi:hypothetical protein
VAGIKRKFHARSPFTTKVMRSKSDGGHSGLMSRLRDPLYRCGNSAGFSPDFPRSSLYAVG